MRKEVGGEGGALVFNIKVFQVSERLKDLDDVVVEEDTVMELQVY